MSIFGTRRPRGFHHEYMFVDVRKDKIKAIEERAERELGRSADEAPVCRHDNIRGMFLDATRYARRRRQHSLPGGIVLNFGVMIILILVLLAVWKILLVL